jgi:hypothetical protein
MTPLETQLVTIFPAFAAVPQAQLDYWVNRALLTTSTWNDDHATMLLACHLMALNGLGTDGTSQIAGGGLTGVSSISVGPLNAKFSDEAVKQQISGDFNASSYGQQFKKLLLARSAGGLVSDSGYYTPYNFDAGQYVNIY